MVDISEHLLNYMDAFLTGALLVIAIQLTFLHVPKRKEWHMFRQSRIYTVVACIVLALAYGLELAFGHENKVLNQLIWFGVASMQALLMTVTCVTFISPLTSQKRRTFLHIIPIVLMTAVIATAFLTHFPWMEYIVHCCLTIFIIQMVMHAYFFIRTYQQSVENLEEIYDDDMKNRVKWVKLLFYSALAMGVLAACVVYQNNEFVDIVFELGIVGYYSFVGVSFANYATNSLFIMKAATSNTMVESLTIAGKRQSETTAAKANTLPEEAETEAQESQETSKETPEHSNELTQAEFTKIAIQRWVEKKRFLQSDISVNNIVAEMGITRQVFNDYFNNILQIPFRSWRIELRIKEAQEMLKKNPEIPTGELYEHCGYNDRSNFHKHFQKVTGMSLTDYRERLPQ